MANSLGTIKAVLFDLDGTLADSAPDLALALNLLLAEHGRPAVPLEITRPYTSSGARGLIKAGFGIDADHADYPALKERFLDLYEQNLSVHTALFDGVAAMLDALDARNIVWGIVTNKAMRFTGAVVAGIGLAARSACTVSGDTTPRAKPHPEPLLHAAAQIAIAPAACLYVGDDLRDVQAARAAGMGALAAAYGYLGVDGDPHDWQADAVINHPGEVLKFL
jgi:phosphoglycolate phosphatase